MKKVYLLKIASYNIAHGREIVGFDMKKIADDILKINPDIVGLQEVDRYAKRTGFIDTVKLLSQYTGYPYYDFAKAIFLEGDKQVYGTEGQYGVAILSKYPIIDSKSYLLESDIQEQRVLEYAKIKVDDIALHFFNTHLSFEDSKLRCAQFRYTDQLTAQYKNCILVGDFNAGTIDEFDLISHLSATCTKKNALITFPSEGITIDNIFFSPNMNLKSSAILNTKNSDHAMLFSDLEVAVSE